MARFLDTSGVTFTPFTYDELTKPLREATEAHDAAQERYDALAEEAGAAGSLLTDADPVAKAAYSRYMDSLAKLSGDLMRDGLTADTARGVSEARRRYRTEVTPIANALARRRELGDEYRKAAASDPTLLAEYDPASQSVDRWLEDPEYGAYRHTSGSLLEKNTGAEVASLAQRIRERGWQLAPGAGGQYFDAFTSRGASLAQVDEAMRVFAERAAGREASTQDPVAALMADVAMSQWRSSGLPEWGGESARASGMEYIRRGLLSAVGKDDVAPAANRGYGTAAKAAGGGGGGTPAQDAPRMNYRTDNRYTQFTGKRRAARKAEKDMETYDRLAQEGGDAWESDEARKLFERYGGGDAEEMGENLRKVYDDALQAKSLYYGNVMDYRNVTSQVAGYIRDGFGRRQIKGMVTDAATGKGLAGKDAQTFMDLIDPSSGMSGNTRYAIDPVEGKVVVNSGTHYYSVEPDIFNNYLFSSRDAVMQYLQQLGDGAAERGDPDTMQLAGGLMDVIGRRRYVGDVIGALGAAYDQFADNPNMAYVFDGVVNALWGDVLHQSSAGYGAKGDTSSTDNKWAYDNGF